MDHSRRFEVALIASVLRRTADMNAVATRHDVGDIGNVLMQP
jgi:hypothetical protein